ncbi:MAG: CopG family transcriptional regulator [Litorimonas sp.]
MTTSLKRIQAYAQPELHRRLEIAAAHPKVSKSWVVQQALELYLSEEQEAARNNPILRRLDQMTRESERLRQRLIVLTEAHALFVRYFLTTVPAPPKAEAEAARSQGAIRFDGYREALETILADKTRHLFDGIEDAFLGKSAFFTEEELDRLENPHPNQTGGSGDD